MASLVAANFKSTRTGWTAGGGIETLVSMLPGWSMKTEYLYVDLGSTSNSFFNPVGLTNVLHSDIRTHVLRTGLDYQFNRPVVASY